jgi:copper chaperone
MQDTLNLSIEGMHCGACVRRVTNALQTVPGVQINSVEVGSAKLSFNPDDTTPEEITAAVNGIGFPAKVAA